MSAPSTSGGRGDEGRGPVRSYAHLSPTDHRSRQHRPSRTLSGPRPAFHGSLTPHRRLLATRLSSGANRHTRRPASQRAPSGETIAGGRADAGSRSLSGPTRLARRNHSGRACRSPSSAPARAVRARVSPCETKPSVIAAAVDVADRACAPSTSARARFVWLATVDCERAHDPFRGAQQTTGPDGRKRAQAADLRGRCGGVAATGAQTSLVHVRRRPPSAPLGHALGCGGARKPFRVKPKRPLTCTNMVGDTGIEPVTSSVSGTGNAFAGVRPCASVQVSAARVPPRMHLNVAGWVPVGVRVGVRRAAEGPGLPAAGGALIPSSGHAESRSGRRSMRRPRRRWRGCGPGSVSSRTNGASGAPSGRSCGRRRSRPWRSRTIRDGGVARASGSVVVRFFIVVSHVEWTRETLLRVCSHDDDGHNAAGQRSDDGQARAMTGRQGR